MFSFGIEKLGPETFFSSLLRSKIAVPVCIFIAWLNKILIAWLHTDLEGDKSLYLLFSKNLLEGKPVLEQVTLAETGQSAWVYDPAITSPLYSFLAAPFLWITRSYSATSFAVDMIAWSLFFTGLYKIAFALFKERWIANLLILSTGFFLLPHEMISGPKDTLAMGFLLLSVYFAYRLITTKTARVVSSVLLIFSLIFLGLTKYLYSPLIFLLLFILLLYAITLKDKKLLFYSLVCMACCYTIIALFIKIGLPSFQQKASYGVFLPFDGTAFTKGIFIKNLTATYPFISSSVINTNFWGVQLSDIFGVSFTAIQRVFQIADLILIAGMLWLLKEKTLQLSRTLFFILFSVSFFLVATLFYMSLTHKGIQFKTADKSGLGWTYVSDARSFLFPILSLQLLFFFLLFKTNSLHSILRNFLFLLFFIECLHGLYFTSKQMAQSKSIKAYDAISSPVKTLTRGLENLKTQYKDVALITSDAHLRRYAMLKGIKTYSFSNQPCKENALPPNTLYVIATPHADGNFIEKCFAPNLLQPTDAVPPFEIHFYKTTW